jgi:hypothetical protein
MRSSVARDILLVQRVFVLRLACRAEIMDRGAAIGVVATPWVDAVALPMAARGAPPPFPRLERGPPAAAQDTNSSRSRSFCEPGW